MLIFLLPAMYELQGNAMVHCNNGWVFMLSNAKFILLDITQSCHALQFVSYTHVLSVYPWLYIVDILTPFTTSVLIF